MFQFRFVLLALLIPGAGITALLAGTNTVHGVVIPAFDAAANASVSAVTGAIASFSSQSVDAAAAAASSAEVLAAFQKDPKDALDAATENRLLQPAGGSEASSFGLLVAPDGTVRGVSGAKPALEPNLAGLPVVAEALTGVARDGVIVIDGAPIHLAAAPSYDATGRLQGAVLLGWPYNEKLLKELSRQAGTPVLVSTAKGVLGEMPQGATAEGLAGRQPFGAIEGAVGPLPILVPDVARFLVSTFPLYPADASLAVVTLVDRNEAFKAIATLQLGILGATAVLLLLVLGIIASALRAVNRPIEIITEHLSQVQQQGVGVGILPEAGLGPMLRLGKQINMLLQTLPSSRSGGTAPLFGGATSSQDVPAAPPSAFPDSPAPSTPAAPPSLFSSSPTSSPGADAPAPPAAPPAASGALAGLFSDDAPDPLAAFRVPPKSAPEPAPPPQPESAPPESEMQPEATVMFQVPEALLAASATAAPPKTQTPPPQPAPTPAPAANVDDNRTVVAQVPQELLAQVSPKNDVDSADDAHYKEVYEKFVQTRIECGEDTSDLSYDRFVAKLLKNRQQIIEKHKAKSVRFQVYAKDGKAALRALPVRD